eukprot:Stramenopile-MAST_4_protein_2275
MSGDQTCSSHSRHGLYWLRIVRSSSSLGTNLARMYWELSKQIPDTEAAALVELDIDRTYPQHILFRRKNGSGQKSLRRVLLCWVMYEKLTVLDGSRCGYVQGMNMLVGQLLQHVNESLAFEIFVHLMMDAKYNLRANFQVGMKGTLEKCDDIHRLCKEYCPMLALQFEECGILPVAYATEWVLTLYSYVLDGELLWKVWDMFFLYGWTFFNKFTVAILKRFEARVNLAFERERDGLSRAPADHMSQFYAGLKSIGSAGRRRSQQQYEQGIQTEDIIDGLSASEWISRAAAIS